ncbi:hypothetical protein FHS78_003807 [Parvibaculum indicum]|uniref:hypothetical protein n=1 Tax=Parvibaculum indicum TaxID=562969 RepID=UPI00141DC473|nr:hypothetical protein [Parvibaculum indicum]NIJ43492.1 hypothetical protein [Parvibaculum indicum]
MTAFKDFECRVRQRRRASVSARGRWLVLPLLAAMPAFAVPALASGEKALGSHPEEIESVGEKGMCEESVLGFEKSSAPQLQDPEFKRCLLKFLLSATGAGAPEGPQLADITERVMSRIDVAPYCNMDYRIKRDVRNSYSARMTPEAYAALKKKVRERCHMRVFELHTVGIRTFVIVYGYEPDGKRGFDAQCLSEKGGESVLLVGQVSYPSSDEFVSGATKCAEQIIRNFERRL